MLQNLGILRKNVGYPREGEQGNSLIIFDITTTVPTNQIKKAQHLGSFLSLGTHDA